MGELRQLNEQNKLAIWAERVTECRNSGQSVLAWCKEHGICSQTYYKWQKRLFSVGKTAIVNVDPPPSPLQRKQGRPEILLTGPHLFPRIFFPASAVFSCFCLIFCFIDVFLHFPSGIAAASAP